MVYSLVGRSTDRAWRRSRTYTADQIRHRCRRTGSVVKFDRNHAVVSRSNNVVATLIGIRESAAPHENLAREAYAALLRSTYGRSADTPDV